MDSSLIGLALGGLVGIIIGITGAGGGVLAVPLLVFGLHLSILQAAPVGLIAVGLASALGAALGLREGQVRYRAAAAMGTMGMLCAPFGVALASRVPNAPLMAVFAFVLGGVAWRMYRQSLSSASERAMVQLPCVLSPQDGRLVWTLPCTRALLATGMVSGTLSGLLGVGGGFVIVPALSRYTNLPARMVVATSMAVIALVSVGGVTAAALRGHVDLHTAAPFALGAVVALLLGRRLGARLSGARLQQSFAGLCMVVAVLMVARAAGWLTM